MLPHLIDKKYLLVKIKKTEVIMNAIQKNAGVKKDPFARYNGDIIKNQILIAVGCWPNWPAAIRNGARARKDGLCD
jgi:hypothetical protein